VSCFTVLRDQVAAELLLSAAPRLLQAPHVNSVYAHLLEWGLVEERAVLFRAVALSQGHPDFNVYLPWHFTCWDRDADVNAMRAAMKDRLDGSCSFYLDYPMKDRLNRHVHVTSSQTQYPMKANELPITLDTLLASGYNDSLDDYSFGSALASEAVEGRLGLCRLLLTLRADPNDRLSIVTYDRMDFRVNCEVRYALHFAIKHQSVELVTCLLDARAAVHDVCDFDGCGSPPLDPLEYYYGDGLRLGRRSYSENETQIIKLVQAVPRKSSCNLS